MCLVPKSQKSRICMRKRSYIHNMNVYVYGPASRLDAAPPMWTWGWRCMGPWWLWHSGWSWPPAAGKGKQCMQESSLGPHPRMQGLVLSPPLLLLWPVHIELDQCYHSDHLSEREGEKGKRKQLRWHKSLSQCIIFKLPGMLTSAGLLVHFSRLF